MNININLNPYLFQYGFLRINLFGICAALSIITFLISLFFDQDRKKILDFEMLFQLTIEAIFVSIIGARLFFYLETGFVEPWQNFLSIYQGGLSLLGTVIILPIYGIFRLNQLKISFFQIADLFASHAPILQAVARTGCLLVGCCCGVVCNSTNCLTTTYLHPDAVAPLNVPLFAIPIVSMVFSLFLYFFLQAKKKNQHQPGSILGWYLLGEGSARFLVDFFRLERVTLLSQFSLHQAFASVIILAGLGLILKNPFPREKA